MCDELPQFMSIVYKGAILIKLHEGPLQAEAYLDSPYRQITKLHTIRLVYGDDVPSNAKHDLDLISRQSENICIYNRSAHPAQSYLVYWFLNCKKQIPSWVANRFSASHEIPRILWTLKFITAFTSARHLSLSWTRAIQSTLLHPTSCKDQF
jgi:hypothetical protein